MSCDDMFVGSYIQMYPAHAHATFTKKKKVLRRYIFPYFVLGTTTTEVQNMPILWQTVHYDN